MTNANPNSMQTHSKRGEDEKNIVLMAQYINEMERATKQLELFCIELKKWCKAQLLQYHN